MNKSRLKKIVLLSSISTMLLSGCRDNNVQSNDSTKVITTEVATVEECAGPTEAQEINSTIENIKKEYEELTNNKLDESNLFVDRFPQINYLWKDKEGNYIYDYRINFNNNQELEYCDTNNSSKMYAVIVKNDDGSYEPIAGLVDNGDGVKNVTITYCYSNIAYEPSNNYITIDNPTQEDLTNLKKGNDYIKTNYKSSKDKELTLSNKNN